MAVQQQKQVTKQAVVTEEAPPPAPAKLVNLDLAGDVDDLLDEIDRVLEPNAQMFVANYIQKGGE